MVSCEEDYLIFQRQSIKVLHCAVNSFSTRLLSCCTHESVHTYAVSSDCVRDSSSELRCLDSPYVHTRHTYIHATCKRDISVLCEGISMKLGTDIHHAVKVLKVRGQRSRSQLTKCTFAAETYRVAQKK